MKQRKRKITSYTPAAVDSGRWLWTTAADLHLSANKACLDPSSPSLFRFARQPPSPSPRRRRHSRLPTVFVVPPATSCLVVRPPSLYLSLSVTVVNSPTTTNVTSLPLFLTVAFPSAVKTHGVIIAYTTSQGTIDHHPQNHCRCRAPSPAPSANSSGENHREIASLSLRESFFFLHLTFFPFVFFLSVVHSLPLSPPSLRRPLFLTISRISLSLSLSLS